MRFHETTLENGLQVIVIEDHRTPVATHMIWYKNGSADDPIGKSGIAHFLEHLMFKGTEAHPKGAFSDQVAELGALEGGGQKAGAPVFGAAHHFAGIRQHHRASNPTKEWLTQFFF